MATNGNHAPTDAEVWDSLTARYGAGWDDETDIRTRYADLDTDTPRVERIRTRKGPDHLPGSHWESTSCLCSCHYGARTSAQAPACDDAECKVWAKQNAAKAAKVAERKQAAWARKQARAGQVGA